MLVVKNAVVVATVCLAFLGGPLALAEDGARSTIQDFAAAILEKASINPSELKATDRSFINTKENRLLVQKVSACFDKIHSHYQEVQSRLPPVTPDDKGTAAYSMHEQAAGKIVGSRIAWLWINEPRNLEGSMEYGLQTQLLNALIIDVQAACLNPTNPLCAQVKETVRTMPQITFKAYKDDIAALCAL
jgi:hypothetical protein